MPAHIGTRMSLDRAPAIFFSQVLPKKYQDLSTRWMLEKRKAKGHNWVSPANISAEAEKYRASREILCTSYDEYREALDSFNSRLDFTAWFPMSEWNSPESRNLTKIVDTDGFGHFNTEWSLYLKPGTSFDQLVQQRFKKGEVITLIRRFNPERFHQLKRIEATTAKGIKIIWSLH